MDAIEYEALRRAQEMQRQRPQASRSSQPSQPAQTPQSQRAPEPKRDSAPPPVKSNPPVQASPPAARSAAQHPSGDLLSTLFEDKEKLLILALILILSGEESSDPSLILALLYLII